MGQISLNMKNAINSGDLGSIYSGFYVIAHEDPSFSSGKFLETLEYVKGLKIEGFIKVHDGERFKEKSEWTKDYWATLASELVDNFSQERINLLLQVGEFVYAANIIKPKITVDPEFGGIHSGDKKKIMDHQIVAKNQKLFWILGGIGTIVLAYKMLKRN